MTPSLPSGSDRPLVARPFVGAWLVVLVTVYHGQSSYRRFLRLSVDGWRVAADPGDRLGVNYYVYHYAAEAFLAGRDFYDAPPPGHSDFYTFLYPPITVLFWVPKTLLDPFHGYLLHVAITVLACVALAVVIARTIEWLGVPIGWVDVAAIALFLVVGTHSTGTINYGNVNLLLAAGVGIALVRFQAGREWAAGGLVGLVALLKVFPTLIGLYFLRRRSWRAIGGAVATGGGGLVASAVVFGPDTLYRFFVHVLLPRSETDQFVGGYAPDDTYYVTIQRPLSHLLWEGYLPSIALYGGESTAPLLLAAVAVLGVPLAYCYVDLRTRIDRMVAIHATLTVTVVLLPSLRWYLVLLAFSWLSLLYAWGGGPSSTDRAMRVLAAAAVLGVAYELVGWIVWAHALTFLLAVALALGLVYAWFEDVVGTTFFLGGLVAAVTDGPATVMNRVAAAPEPLPAVLDPLAVVATLQLYGALLMLGACVWYKWQRGVGADELLRALQEFVAQVRSLPDELRRAIEQRRRWSRRGTDGGGEDP